MLWRCTVWVRDQRNILLARWLIRYILMNITEPGIENFRSHGTGMKKCPIGKSCKTWYLAMRSEYLPIPFNYRMYAECWLRKFCDGHNFPSKISKLSRISGLSEISGQSRISRLLLYRDGFNFWQFQLSRYVRQSRYIGLSRCSRLSQYLDCPN